TPRRPAGSHLHGSAGARQPILPPAETRTTPNTATGATGSGHHSEWLHRRVAMVTILAEVRPAIRLGLVSHFPGRKARTPFGQAVQTLEILVLVRSGANDRATWPVCPRGCSCLATGYSDRERE